MQWSMKVVKTLLENGTFQYLTLILIHLYFNVVHFNVV